MSVEHENQYLGSIFIWMILNLDFGYDCVCSFRSTQSAQNLAATSLNYLAEG